MSPANIPGTVQDSKAKRQERLKSRFRDRGGIFVPSEGNVLADILLSRGVNGESPVKKRASRKSAVTPKSRAPAASKAAAKTKTSRTGTSKRGTRKSVATPHRNEGKENALPGTKTSRGRLKTPKLQEAKTNSGPSLPRVAQRIPFADQLACAINSTKTPTTFPTSEKSRPAVAPMSDVPSLLGESGKSVENRKGKTAAVDRLPRYSEELGAANEMTTSPAKTTMSPLVLALESQRKVAKERTGTTEAPRNERSNTSGTRPPLGAAETILHAANELEDSDSDDSDVPLAKICAKRVDTQAKSREDDPLPQQTKRRSVKAKAVDGASKKQRTQARVNPSSSARKVGVSQEKNTSAKAPRKRTKVTMNDTKGEKEHEDEPPKKKRRRAADPAVSRRNRKEDKEITRSAGEVSVVTMDNPMPSPVKQQLEPAARRKPASKAKPPSRTATAARARRRRGLPPAVLRRIKINAQTLPALGEVDDDDPIDFLRS